MCKMICRLCLNDAQNYLQIFSDTGEVIEVEAISVIAKYFFIEMHTEDIVSNKICMDCWQQVDDFHKFCVAIFAKQEVLKKQWICPPIKSDIDALKIETPAEESLNDSKDITLCEPEIDIYTEVGIFVDGTAFDADEEFNETESRIPPADPVEEEKPKIKEKLKGKPRGKYKTKKISKTVVKRQSARLCSSATVVRTRSANSTNTKNAIPTTINTASTTQMSAESCEEMDIENKRENLKTMIQEMDAYIAENTQLSCCICSTPLPDFNVLKKHFRQEHQCVGYVLCCESRFRKRTLYVDHLRLHKDPDYFKCTICNKTLASRGCLTNHMETMHPPEGTLQFACNLCPRKFSKQYILDYHIKSRHSTDRNYKCAECNKSFKNNAILKQHLKAVHLNEYESVCEVCGKQLKTAQNLASHMEAIHNYTQKPEVQCVVCLKWVKNVRCLAKHMVMHREEASGQEFKCKHCDVVKSSRRALSSHVRYHHSTKIYKCKVCGKEFKRNRSLEEHMATHTGKHLYTCPFCPKTFKSHGNMHKHKTNNHSNEWVRKHTQPSQRTLTLLSEMQSNEV